MSGSLPESFKHPRLESGFRGHGCQIAAVGSYVPERVLTNKDLEAMVETSDEWIRTRTGIQERRIASEAEATSDLAAEAARRALAKAGVTADQVGLIIVATLSPDMLFPSTACLVQDKIGASRAAAFDLEAACSGFVYALEVGQQFVMTGTHEVVLVIGAEKISSLVDWTDRNTCVLFGDGAGAAVLKRSADSLGVITSSLGADGGKATLLSMPGGGSRCPATTQSLEERMHFLKMDGKETFKNAVQAMVRSANTVLDACGLGIEDIHCVIPHQANRRIIDAVGDRLQAREDQVYINVDRFGNTSAASVIIALQEAVEAGRIQRGNLVLLVVFGAGLTWGASILQW